MATQSPAKRRTFKDKLRDLVNEAEVVQAQALRAEQTQDVRSLATDLLVRGYPNAFSEFHLFAVSQAAPGNVPSAPNDTIPAYVGSPVHGQGAAGTTLSVPVLRTVHTHLMRAEQAKRDNDRMVESEAYNELGLFFERAGNLPLATYQYRRCLAIAEEVGWEEGRLATHMALGLVLRQQGLFQDSLEHHNTQLEIATGRDRQDELAEANQHLVQVHSLIAEAAMNNGDHETAMQHLQACKACATECAADAAEGACEHQMGLLAQKQGDFAEALRCQQAFLALSSQANSQEQVAQAHFAIAECHEELGDIDAAVTALEQYMDLTRLSSPLAHSQACCKFGALYYRAGEYTQAVMYFEKFFEVARGVGDVRVLDTARFNLGVARGAAWQAEYMRVADADLEKLLNWKNLRISFTDYL